MGRLRQHRAGQRIGPFPRAEHVLIDARRALLAIVFATFLPACSSQNGDQTKVETPADTREPVQAEDESNSAQAPPARDQPIAPKSRSAFPVGREWRETVAAFVTAAELDGRAFDAAQIEMAECMAARGFEYMPISYVDSDIELGRLANPLNREVAERYGYHVPPVQGIENPNQSGDAA